MNQGTSGATDDAELDARVARTVMGWNERVTHTRPTYSRAEIYGEEHPFRPVKCDHCTGLVLDRLIDLGWSYELYADGPENLQHARFFRPHGDGPTGEAAHAAATPISGDARRRSICHAAIAAVERGTAPPTSIPC